MLVGRDREVELLRSLVTERVPVTVAGPAGIGKSSLVRQVLDDEPEARAAIALASQRWSPLQPLARVVRGAVRDPESAAGAILRAGTGPLLVDDLQWADDATLEVLGLLVGRVALVATVRDTDPDATHALDSMALLGGTLLELDPLDPEAARELLDRQRPDLGAEARSAVLDAAAGNPLLLEHLAAGPGAPTTLVSALVERMGDLDGPARSALERLAVLGRPASEELLGAGAAALVGAGLAVADPEASAPDVVAIAHPLLGELLVEELGPTADDLRRALAGEVEAAEAAHLLAAAGDAEPARRRALDAAASAAGIERAVLLDLAVSLADDLDPARRLEAARLFTAASQPERAVALCAVDGRDALPPLERGPLLAAEAEAAWMQGRSSDAVALTERALADLQGTGSAWEALVLAGSTVTATFLALDGRPALERATEAVELAERLGEGRAYTRTRLASVLATSGDPTWVEHYQRAVDLAREEGDPDQYRTTIVGQLLATWTAGDVDEAERLARKELEREVPTGFDVSWLSVASYAALLDLLAGRLPGEVVDEFAPILGREPAFRHRAFLEAAVLVAQADAGHHRAAADLARGAAERAGSEPQMRSVAAWARIEAAWAAGQVDEACDLVGPLLALGVGDYPSAVMGRLVGAHAARLAGREVPGPAPAPLLRAWSAAPVEWEGLALTATDPAAASSQLLAAAERWQGCDVRAELRCRWAAGDVLVEHDPERARCLLEAVEVGAVGRPPLLDRARRSLRAAGVARRSPVSGSLAGLTAREVEVLEQVAQGRRTAEIAAALSVASSTVDSLVRSASRKLGVSTRAAAAALVEAERAAIVHDEAADPRR